MDKKNLSIRLNLVMKYLLRKSPDEFKTATAVAKYINYPQSNLSAALKGNERYLGEAIVDKFVNAFPEISYSWLREGKGEMFTTKDKMDIIEGMRNLAPQQSNLEFIQWLDAVESMTLPDPLQQLANIKKIKANGKQTNANEGHIVHDDELVPVKTYIIPIKGFAGLKKHFFADEYISEKFEETVTYVHKSERVPKLLKIQADGNSMPPLISPGDFVVCEPINDLTLDYKFRPDKIYCFFHHLRGILFKRAENKPHNQVELSSDNPDKIEYPNEIFDIGEFKKILIVSEIIKKV